MSLLPAVDSAAQVNVDKLLGRRRPQPHRNWSQRHVKLLVVGDSGLVHLRNELHPFSSSASHSQDLDTKMREAGHRGKFWRGTALLFTAAQMLQAGLGRRLQLRLSSGWPCLQGKTTLCQCLLSVPGSDLQLHDGTATSHQQFLDDPESLCSTVSWDDTNDKVKWVYKVQDTPGTETRHVAILTSCCFHQALALALRLSCIQSKSDQSMHLLLREMQIAYSL